MGLSRFIAPVFKLLSVTVIPATMIDKGMDIAKDKIKEELAAVQQSLKIAVSIIFFSLLLFIFLSTTLALVLAQLLDSFIYGFAIVSLIHSLVLGVLIAKHYKRSSD